MHDNIHHNTSSGTVKNRNKSTQSRPFHLAAKTMFKPLTPPFFGTGAPILGFLCENDERTLQATRNRALEAGQLAVARSTECRVPWSRSVGVSKKERHTHTYEGV